MLHATAAFAQGPLKFPDSQFEPIKWAELAGWTADDHLAAFAAYQSSCRALRKRSSDDRGPLARALSSVCRKAADLQPQDAGTVRVFFEQNFRPVHRASGRGRGAADRLFRADRFGLALSQSRISD